MCDKTCASIGALKPFSLPKREVLNPHNSAKIGAHILYVVTMTFVERLEGTPLEGDAKAWIVCAVLDWCRSNQVSSTPTEREWCKILGCFPKGKARRGEEKKGYYPQGQVHKLMEQLDSEGVVAMVSGKGRQRNSFDIPENKNLLADKKASYEKRKSEWKLEVINKTRKDVEKGTASWEGVQAFFEYWAEADADWNMRWEILLKSKGCFSIGGRWCRWKDKKLAEQKAPTLPLQESQTPTYIGKGGKEVLEKENAAFDRWLAEQGIKDITIEVIERYKKENNIL